MLCSLLLVLEKLGLCGRGGATRKRQRMLWFSGTILLAHTTVKCVFGLHLPLFLVGMVWADQESQHGRGHCGRCCTVPTCSPPGPEHTGHSGSLLSPKSQRQVVLFTLYLWLSSSTGAPQSNSGVFNSTPHCVKTGGPPSCHGCQTPDQLAMFSAHASIALPLPLCDNTCHPT